MDELEIPFRSDGVRADLSCLVLRAFSRFEAALKQANYAVQQGDRLIVEYRRFAATKEGVKSFVASC